MEVLYLYEEKPISGKIEKQNAGNNIINFCNSTVHQSRQTMKIANSEKRLQVHLTRAHLWLCLPFIISCISDMSVTMIGQDPLYWNLGYQYINEANPVGYWALSIHPGVFIVYQLLYIEFVLIVILLLPRMLAKILATFLVMSHSYAVFGWLKYVFQTSYSIRFGVLILPAVLLIYVFSKVEASQN
jgi:hypothetical protein